MNISVRAATSVASAVSAWTPSWTTSRPHLAQAREATLDVARAPRLEVAHRQVEQLPREEIERLPVDHDCRPAQDVALEESGARDRDEHAGHGSEQEVEQS